MAIMDMMIVMIDKNWFSSSLSLGCCLGGVSSSVICITVCAGGCISFGVLCVIGSVCVAIVVCLGLLLLIGSVCVDLGLVFLISIAFSVLFFSISCIFMRLLSVRNLNLPFIYPSPYAFVRCDDMYSASPRVIPGSVLALVHGTINCSLKMN